jgi:hypothetical protein
MNTQFLSRNQRWRSFNGRVADKAIFFLILLLQLTKAGCAAPPAPGNPPGYDLTKPIKYNMPAVLEEISGIAFRQGEAATVYAEQDEEGRLFYFHLGDADVKHTKFSKRGDYEDLAICNGQVIMLRSDGVLFTFPLVEAGNKEIGNTKELPGLLPEGEYESLYADENNNTLYVLCKNCSDDKSSRGVSGHIFTVDANGQLTPKDRFLIDEKAIAALAGKEKMNVKPSGMARHPLSHQWYIISSVNKLLVITDAAWKPVGIYILNPALFTQPEGIAFDKTGNLYISNEKGNAANGSILKFIYRKNKIVK